MDDRTIRARILLMLLLLAATAVAWLPLAGGAEGGRPDGTLAVHFLDVGQGDATLIETPEGIQVLVDGGPDGSVLRQLGRVMSWRDRSIDVVVATHPDGDHIGGLIDVLERFDVATILVSQNEGDTPTAAAFAEAVDAEGAQVLTVRAGQQLLLGASTTLSVLFPATSTAELSNNVASIVTRLTFGETDILMTGDAPQYIEEYLVDAYGDSLQSEVLKVGHHGSKTSTAEAFVSAVAPDYAVISAGSDNPYGHPHQQVLDTLSSIEVVGTYEAGTVSFYSDGDSVWTQ